MRNKMGKNAKKTAEKIISLPNTMGKNKNGNQSTFTSHLKRDKIK